MRYKSFAYIFWVTILIILIIAIILELFDVEVIGKFGLLSLLFFFAGFCMCIFPNFVHKVFFNEELSGSEKRKIYRSAGAMLILSWTCFIILDLEYDVPRLIVVIAAVLTVSAGVLLLVGLSKFGEEALKCGVSVDELIFVNIIAAGICAVIVETFISSSILLTTYPIIMYLVLEIIVFVVFAISVLVIEYLKRMRKAADIEY
ncbi:MAG: hypothetical protein QMC78_03430 [Methanocellales archaeon]|nr:hypothetical protein [Methanocellales archaeon]